MLKFADERLHITRDVLGRPIVLQSYGSHNLGGCHPLLQTLPYEASDAVQAEHQTRFDVQQCGTIRARDRTNRCFDFEGK